jgi:SAM-dependent methyltransferase
MILPFELPPIAGSTDRPVWDGAGFVLGGRRLSVLEYNESTVGWSEDLTEIHEHVAGGRHPIDVASRQDAIRQLQRFLKQPRPLILEIGCSSGFFLREATKAIPNATFIGADIVKGPLYRLAAQLPQVPMFRFDLLKCPFQSHTFDAVVMLNVLEHIEDDVGALRKVHDLLRTGGILILEVPAGPRLMDIYDENLHHFRRYSSRALRSLLGQLGFTIMRSSHLGFLVYPAFLAFKLRNRVMFRHVNRRVFDEQATMTSRSNLFSLAMRFENSYMANFRLPCGIRCVITGRADLAD